MYAESTEASAGKPCMKLDACIYPRSLLQNLEDWACGRYSRYSFDLPELTATVVLTTLSHLNTVSCSSDYAQQQNRSDSCAPCLYYY